MSSKSNLSLGLLILAFTSLSYAGIGERSWSFDKGETVTMDFSALSPIDGTEYSCESFSPNKVSFIIKYDNRSSGSLPINVIADDASKVSHDRNNHTFKVTNATSLHIQLPGNGKYFITNTTGNAVLGSICDTGIYG